jgi:glycosyltransferase involved in cell wall biosynthesis
VNNRYQFFEDSVLTIKSMDKKLALTIHNALPKNIDPLTDEMGEFYDKLWGRKLMHAADVLTGVSTNTINTTVPKAERKKTHLILNGVNYKRFRHMNSKNRKVRDVKRQMGFENGTTILTNGRLVNQKGQIYLLHAFADLVNRNNEDINLLMIGKGPLQRSFHRFVKSRKLQKRFKIVYGIDDDNLPYYYNSCKMFSLPSLYEPAGLALLEALSCEMPSIVSKVGGIPEIAGEHAFYTKPNDYYGIKKKIEYVMENEKAAAAMAKKGRERMIKYHDWDKIARQYEDLFLSTIRY